MWEGEISCTCTTLSEVAMNVVYSPDYFSNYLNQGMKVPHKHPIIISKYIEESKWTLLQLMVKWWCTLYQKASVHSGATLILKIELGNTTNWYTYRSFYIWFIIKNLDLTGVNWNGYNG